MTPTCAESIRVMHPLFQAGEGGSTPTSALDLWLEEIDYQRAKAINRMWHSVLPRINDPKGPMTAGVHYAATANGIIYAVAIWTHPVNKSLPQTSWLELRRLATSPDAPRNTASRMLRIMAMLIRRKRPEIVRLVSYQDTEAHTGGIYRAAGWDKAKVKGQRRCWDMPGRRRPKSQSTAPKQRWEATP